MDRVILHCDLNSFFASASLLSRPELKNKPVAVCGDASKRHGIILAKNQLAKRTGIKTGQAIWQARMRCPNLVTILPEYPLYMELSTVVNDIYKRYTGHIEPFGIDESWLDITPFSPDHGLGARIAEELRQTIHKETGLTVSIGVSWNKIFAKLGSDYRKPDAVTIIGRGNYQSIAWPLPAGDLLYVGRATKKKLHAVGIETIGDLAKAPAPFLKSLLGKNGLTLHGFANGVDLSPVRSVEHGYAVKGIGNSMTTRRDLISDTDVKQAFLILSEMVAWRARKKRLQGRVICIYLRDDKLAHITRQVSLNRPTFVSDDLADHAMALYKQNWDASARPIRSIGIRITKLSPIDKYTQLGLFDGRRLEMQSLEFAKDDIVARFGKNAITRACLIRTEVGERNPKEQHVVHPLSYFRG